jgi:hypothetical protein
MEILILEIILSIIVFYFIRKLILESSTKSDNETIRPAIELLPTQEIPNDKLVIVNNVTQIEVDGILTGFCNMYNKESYQALPRAYKLDEKNYAITFPYDIEFTIFCFFINYVHYPIGIDKTFEVTGWTTTEIGYNCITEKPANKKMLFVPADDTEHDNVYFTASDNIAFKLGFAKRHAIQLLDPPRKSFKEPTIELSELANKEQKDYM